MLCFIEKQPENNGPKCFWDRNLIKSPERSEVVKLNSMEEEKKDAHAPWLDLPDPLTEHIAERLPLSDYLRFAAVCRRWRSIQTDHRRRHAPGPPPSLPLPWLLPSDLGHHPSLPCLSPFESQQFPRLRLSLRTEFKKCLGSSGGWLLMLEPVHLIIDPPTAENAWFLSLFNPITNVETKLPKLTTAWTGAAASRSDIIAAASSSCPPDSVALVLGHNQLFLFRLELSRWTKLPLPEQATINVSSVIFCKGKFYCSCDAGAGLIVVDPLVSAAVQFINMDQTPLSPPTENLLVNSCGEVLLLSGADLRREFQMFRADISEKRWVSMDGIGRNRALFLGRRSSVLLPAGEIGAEGNCVYVASEVVGVPGTPPWIVIDLGTGRVRDEGPVQGARARTELGEYGMWIVPSLDSVGSK